MADENWTVVAGRRAARSRRTRSSVAPPLPAEDCDESTLLHRLKQSIARVQKSTFFQRFLLQAQSAPVSDLLSTVAAKSCPETLHRGLHNDVQENPQQTDQPNQQDHRSISLPLKDSTAEKAVDRPLDAMACDARLQASEIVQNLPTTSAIDSVAAECELSASACRHGRASGDATCSCDNTATVQFCTEQCSLDVVLYGLGSIVDSEVSRCQLALILLLKHRFSWVGAIEVYDPILTPSECKVIKSMGCLPIAADEKGRRSVSSPTLFYMPHCEDWLYDNVLQANWAPHTLRQIVILGNSFQDYQERWALPLGRRSVPPSYVLQYQQVAKEVPLEATSSVELPGFNNMSWHFMSQT